MGEKDLDGFWGLRLKGAKVMLQRYLTTATALNNSLQLIARASFLSSHSCQPSQVGTQHAGSTICEAALVLRRQLCSSERLVEFRLLNTVLNRNKTSSLIAAVSATADHMSLFEAILGTAGKAAGDLFGPDNHFRRPGAGSGAHKQPAGVKAPPAAARAPSDAVQGSAIPTQKPRKKRKAELQKQGGEPGYQTIAKLTCFRWMSSGVTQSLSAGRSGPEDAAGSPDTSQAAPSKKLKATKAEENGATATVEKLGKKKKKQRPAASQLIATPAAALEGRPPAAQEAMPAKKRKINAGTAVDNLLVDKAESEDGDDNTKSGLQQVCG